MHVFRICGNILNTSIDFLFLDCKYVSIGSNNSNDDLGKKRNSKGPQLAGLLFLNVLTTHTCTLPIPS